MPGNSKKWPEPPDWLAPIRREKWLNEFKKQQEEKLDDRDGWRPKENDDYESLPINGEYAIVLGNERRT